MVASLGPGPSRVVASVSADLGFAFFVVHGASRACDGDDDHSSDQTCGAAQKPWIRCSSVADTSCELRRASRMGIRSGLRGPRDLATARLDVTVGGGWEVLVDPNVAASARGVWEITPGAPDSSTYVGPLIDRRRAELSTSGSWRWGLSLIDDETLEAITLDMLRHGKSTRYLFVVWQVPFVLAVASLIACAVYFTTAAVARHRKRQTVELAASASTTGKCPECAYPTDGLAIGICPECGRDHARLLRRLELLRARYQRWFWVNENSRGFR